ncbi:hypothetical protein ACIO3O_07840 [Streptomyces sp. NPDC087440]|uniref:hypothetical protein n=1 Tax=Streptomyces sp. NPDC087440 TaxID=3365790 RepID=UPI00381569D6
MTAYAYADRCEELFALGAYARVRAAATEGLAEAGPDPVLQRWLGLAHAAEEDDDHDDEAEAAYEEGLRLWPDDLGLLVSYLELCLRADGWEHPARERRAQPLRDRIAELAPPGSPEAQQVEAALGWAGRGYWEDTRAKLDRARAEGAALRNLGAVPAAHPEDLHATEAAAAAETLGGPWNAPLRLIHRYRIAAYVAALALSFLTNTLLVRTGTLSFSLWGWFWYVPLFLAEAKLKQTRQLARERAAAAVEARYAVRQSERE